MLNVGSVRPRVLVVDDRPANLFAMEKILQGLNAEIVTASSGNEALREILHGNFAVVLLDVQMPDMDGFETAALIHENERTKDLPIIFVTAISKEEKYVFEGYDAGAVDYLFKPIEPRLLLAKTRVFLQLWHSKHELEREIAGRKHMERQLRVAQRLEALGQLVAGVGHEINNPLTYVLGNLTIARDELERMGREHPNQQLGDLPELLEDVQSGADRIRRIVLSLKRFSMMREYATGPCDVGDAINLATHILGNQLQTRAQLVKDLADVPRVYADSGLLEQVFVNILMNAIEALPERNSTDNEIRVTTRLADPSRVVVEVTDNGQGISPEQLDRIFDPFFTTKEIGKGTGLGLSICHEIVTSMRGDITVESQVGQGTTFRMSFPVADLQTQEGTESAPESAPGAGLAQPESAGTKRARILVVDDEPLLLRILRRRLSDYEVVTTTDGREAAAMCAAAEFDLILCDLMMPAMSGIDLYDQIQRDHPGTENKIVFMTGGAFSSGAQDFLASVPNACLAKPFDDKELEQQLRMIGSNGSNGTLREIQGSSLPAQARECKHRER